MKKIESKTKQAWLVYKGKEIIKNVPLSEYRKFDNLEETNECRLEWIKNGYVPITLISKDSTYKINPNGTFLGRGEPSIRGRKHHQNLEKDIIKDCVSRRHATIGMKDDEFYIMDLGSLNGTYVNELTIGQMYDPTFGHDNSTIRQMNRGIKRLSDGDIINLAYLIRDDIKFEFTTKKPEPFNLKEMFYGKK